MGWASADDMRHERSKARVEAGQIVAEAAMPARGRLDSNSVRSETPEPTPRVIAEWHQPFPGPTPSPT